MVPEPMSSLWELSFGGIAHGESPSAKAHCPHAPDHYDALLLDISCIPTEDSICLFESIYSSSPSSFEDLHSAKISVNAMVHLLGSMHFESFIDTILAHVSETLGALALLLSIDSQSVFAVLFSGFSQSPGDRSRHDSLEDGELFRYFVQLGSLLPGKFASGAGTCAQQSTIL